MPRPVLDIIDEILAEGHADDAKVGLSIGMLRRIGGALRTTQAGERTVAAATSMILGKRG